MASTTKDGKLFCNQTDVQGEGGRRVKVCTRPIRHVGVHAEVDYRPLSHHPWHEVARNFTRQVEAGRIALQSWGCDKCGARQEMAQTNKMYWEGECENCGWVTDLRRKGFNFTVVVGVNMKREAMRELIQATGFKPPLQDN